MQNDKRLILQTRKENKYQDSFAENALIVIKQILSHGNEVKVIGSPNIRNCKGDACGIGKY